MPRFLKVSGGIGTETIGPILKMRCPGCLHMVTLQSVHKDRYIVVPSARSQNQQAFIGFRICPNDDCQTIVYTAASSADTIIETYPKERIDFDASNLPDRILESLEEAITCHANECYVAAGIMIRKTLEALCEDQQAQGPNLKARIASLGTLIVLPAELLSGLDELRILGNDAAHVEARTYDQIGKEEIEVSLEFAKEVLKAVYQYTSLLARLKALKKVLP